MAGNLKESLEGLGTGLLGGLVIGMVESDWVRVLIVLALIAYAGKTGQKNNVISTGSSFRISLTGIAAFVAILAGLYISGQQLFEVSPKESVERWVRAGYSPAKAREMYLKKLDLEGWKSASPSSPVLPLLQSLPKPEGFDSLSSNTDNILISRIDSLQAMLMRLMTGENTPQNGNLVTNTLASNLFSSRSSEDFCQELDPDAYPDTLSYYDAIDQSGLEELKALTIADSSLSSAKRFELAKLMWRLICTIESDTATNWAQITDPELQGNDPEKMHLVYKSQDSRVFGSISDWVKINIKKQNDFFVKLNALIKRIS